MQVLYPDKNINYSSKIITSYPRTTINKNEVSSPIDKKGAFTVPFPNNSSDSNLIITLNSNRNEYIHENIYINRLLHFNIDKITTDNENIIGEMIIEHKNLTNVGKAYTCYLLESTSSMRTDGTDLDKMLLLPEQEVTNMDITLDNVLPISSDCIIYDSNTNTNNKINKVCVFTKPIIVNTESKSKILKYADQTTLFQINPYNPSNPSNVESFNGYKEGAQNLNENTTTMVPADNISVPDNENIWIDCNPTGVGEDEITTYNVPINSKMMKEEQESQLMKTTVNYGMFLIALVICYALVPLGYKGMVIDPVNLIKDEHLTQKNGATFGALTRIRSADITISLIFIGIIITLIGLDPSLHTYGRSSALFIAVFYLLSFGLIQLKKQQSEFMTTSSPSEDTQPIVTEYPDDKDKESTTPDLEPMDVSDYGATISIIVVFLIAHGVKVIAALLVATLIVLIMRAIGIVTDLGQGVWLSSLIVTPLVYIIEFAKQVSKLKQEMS